MNAKQFLNALLIFSVIALPLHASEELLEANGESISSPEQFLDSIKLEKKQIENMLDKMAASGRISKEDAQKAKRELASMDEDHLNTLKDKAVNQIKAKNLLKPEN
jgi:hypothetical protein